MCFSESTLTVRGALFLPGERCLGPGDNEIRRRHVPLAGEMGLTSHYLVVELVPDARSIETIWMALFSVLKAHIGNRAGKISQAGHVGLGGREKGRVTQLLKRGR